jgi:hypothetical protein
LQRYGAPTVYVASARALLVNRIDVVRNPQRTHIFNMTMIRLSGSPLHAARVPPDRQSVVDDGCITGEVGSKEKPAEVVAVLKDLGRGLK